ncbi:MAG TPA: hypothetical protein VNS79_03205 [Sphingobium sp.]|nr:hypothetical protein [Sphingobium sp.]
MIPRLVALAGRLETRPGLLGGAKLANVALAMVWGFVVTFVFVRLLPIGEFRTFLLLIAFANFTVSAELGLSAIVYSRLRRDQVTGEGRFRVEEMSALFWLMTGIIATGGAMIGLAIALGGIPTRYPLLFIAFYGVSAINLLTVLARRALAALDHNLWWEALDFLRRASGIVLLLASLIGLPILDAVLAQLAIALLILWLGMATIQRSLGMAARQWLAVRAGAGHVRAHYLADFGRTGALTLFDVAAYNAPYFTIAAATQDPRPLLLFDFVFKMSRALSAVIRALVETALPALTRAWFGDETERLRSGLVRLTGGALLVSLAAALALLLVGGPLAAIIFDGKIRLEQAETGMIMLLLLALGVMCVSVYLQTGLGRFGALVGPSFLFLVGSLISVPVALALQGAAGWSLSQAFMLSYMLVHLALALVHGRLLGQVGKGARA